MFSIQAVLATLGSLCLTVGRVRLGDRAISRPFMSAIGGVLVAPLILCNLLSRFSELPLDPQTDFPAYTEVEVDDEFEAEFEPGFEAKVEADPLETAILGPVVTVMALLIAGGLVYVGLQTGDALPGSMPAAPPAPVAPRDELPLPDPFAQKPKPRETVAASKPAVKFRASPPVRASGNTVDPSEWDAVIGQLDASLEANARRRRDFST